MTATSRGAKPSSLTLHLQGAAISYFTLLVELTKSMYYAVRSKLQRGTKMLRHFTKMTPLHSEHVCPLPRCNPHPSPTNQSCILNSGFSLIFEVHS